jgi:hypothetical protein
VIASARCRGGRRFIHCAAAPYSSSRFVEKIPDEDIFGNSIVGSDSSMSISSRETQPLHLIVYLIGQQVSRV